MTALENTPPRMKARLAGAAYLLNLAAFVPGVLILGRLVVPGDAATTAANFQAHADLIRFGFAANLIGTAAYVTVTGLFFELFRGVSETISRLAALFSLIGCAVLAVSTFLYIAPLIVLTGEPYLAPFRAGQPAALAMVFVRFYVECFNVSFAFFAAYCLMIGYLVFRSGFLPRLLGVGMAAAGLGYLTFLSPPLAHAVGPYNVLPGMLGEGALTVWLLLAGVNVEGWERRRVESGKPRGRGAATVGT